jgi:hypothetical protein
VRIVAVILAALAMTTLGGCVGDWFVIRTIEEIKRSDSRAEYTSNKAPDKVTDCMMQTLYSYSNSRGERPYSEVTTQTYGTTRAIMLRTPKNQMYGGADELLFLIENSFRDGGAKSNVWVNQRLLYSKQYLANLARVIGVCL